MRSERLTPEALERSPLAEVRYHFIPSTFHKRVTEIIYTRGKESSYHQKGGPAVNPKRRLTYALIVIFILLAFFSSALVVFGMIVIDTARHLLGSLGAAAPEAEPVAAHLRTYGAWIQSLLAPVVFGGALATFVLIWLVLRLFLSPVVRALKEQEPHVTIEAESRAPETPSEQRIEKASAVSLLSLLQQEGRLIDFLQEDLSRYQDSQIGAAVRSVHQGCNKALAETTTVEPVVSGEEGSEFVVEKGFDPSAIKLIGNVAGDPPFKGILRHHGWRLSRLQLPQVTVKQETAVIVPAEVEIV